MLAGQPLESSPASTHHQSETPAMPGLMAESLAAAPLTAGGEATTRLPADVSTTGGWARARITVRLIIGLSRPLLTREENCAHRCGAD